MTRQQLLQSELRPGEELLWSEEPDALAFLRGENVFSLLFMAVWIAFVGVAAWQSEPNIVPLIMLAFGLFIGASTVWEVAQSLFTLYAITNSRLLIVRTSPWSSETESYTEQDIRFLKKSRSKLTGNSLVFTTVSSTGSKGRIRHREIGFFGIEDVDFVEALVERHFRYRDTPARSTVRTSE